MDIERNPGPPCSLLDVHPSAVSFDSMPARYSFSTIPIGLVNVVARKVYTQEELFVIRAQNYRWSNNSLYYRLKSLGIFKYRGRRSGFSSKLCLQTNNQAIPAICSSVVGLICVPHIIFDKHLVLPDWPGSLAII